VQVAKALAEGVKDVEARAAAASGDFSQALQVWLAATILASLLISVPPDQKKGSSLFGFYSTGLAMSSAVCTTHPIKQAVMMATQLGAHGQQLFTSFWDRPAHEANSCTFVLLFANGQWMCHIMPHSCVSLDFAHAGPCMGKLICCLV